MRQIDRIFTVTLFILITLLCIKLGINIIMAVIVGTGIYYCSGKAIKYHREDLN